MGTYMFVSEFVQTATACAIAKTEPVAHWWVPVNPNTHADDIKDTATTQIVGLPA